MKGQNETLKTVAQTFLNYYEGEEKEDRTVTTA
jgi:hypothetical protein